MTPKQQRIAIAEACGWTGISDWGAGGINGKHPKEPWTEVIPDYLNDLNAIHSAVLQKFNGPAHEGWAFIDNLRVACGIPHRSACMALVCATAAQRAEAFLRTLNLWKQ
jgi:hypothetical protein